MMVVEWLWGFGALAVAIYMIAALLRPEKF
jgi:K+-transporting ATPase KdpF subunit